MLAFWFAYLIVLAGLVFVLAKKEIQTEKEKGWAAGLPTWRIRSGVFVTPEGEEIPLTGYKHRLSRWIVGFMGGRELTGYHLYLTLLVLFVTHVPLPYILFFGDWSWRWECIMLSLLPLTFLIEDFLWFVLNPEWGIKNFRPGKILWHPRWVGPIPDAYLQYVILAGVLIWLGLPALS